MKDTPDFSSETPTTTHRKIASSTVDVDVNLVMVLVLVWSAFAFFAGVWYGASSGVSDGEAVIEVLESSEP